MARLYCYFGFVGIASIVACGAALCLLAAFAPSRRRTPAYLAALALAILGFILAKVNSYNISQIEVDRSAEEAAIKERRSDRSAAEPLPAYREQGKQRRDEAARPKPSDLAEAGEEAETAAPRRLPEADLIRADHYDRLNLFLARLTPWLALVLVCLDYLSRFNRTLGYLPPIPIAGRWLDSLFRKTHVVHIQTSDAAVVRHYLADVVRKGETFIYLGEADPVPDAALHRWRLGRWRWQPLHKLTIAGGGFPSSTFVLDSAWFGRYCFVATDLNVARDLAADLAEYLRARTVPRATAWRTVHVVWGFSRPLLIPRLKELATLAKETNFKLVVVSPDPPLPDAAAIYEECLKPAPARRRSQARHGWS